MSDASSVIFSDGEDLSSSEWDRFVAAHPAGRQQQSSRWAEFQQSRGWTVLRIAAGDSGDLSAVAQVQVRPLPIGRLGYVARGPLVAIDRPDVIGRIGAALLATARRERIDVLVVDPPDAETANSLAGVGFGPARFKVTLPATTEVDLEGDEEDVLARMRSKTRYNIRKGLRAGVVVRKGSGADRATFHSMLQETAHRQGFAANAETYTDALLAALDRPDESALFIAEHEGEPLAGILVTAFGDRAVYKRGAWSGKGASLHPNEVLHWSAMRWAREGGRRWYDFDGIDPDLADSLFIDGRPSAKAVNSVTRFKLGFGGGVVPLPATMVYIRNPAVRFAHDRLYPRIAHLPIVKRLARRVQVS